MFCKLHEKLLLWGWQKLPNAVVEMGCEPSAVHL